MTKSSNGSIACQERTLQPIHGADRTNPTAPDARSKQGVIEQLPAQNGGTQRGSLGNVVGAMSFDDMRQIVQDQRLEPNRHSHNIAGGRKTAILGAGGPEFESRRPDQLSPSALQRVCNGALFEGAPVLLPADDEV